MERMDVLQIDAEGYDARILAQARRGAVGGGGGGSYGQGLGGVVQGVRGGEAGIVTQART